MSKGYTYKEATEEEINDWQENELKWWADQSLTIIVIASVTIFGLLGIMGLTMATIQLGVYQ